MGSQVVDTSTAEEFMREAMEKATGAELDGIVELLETKAARFAGLLSEPGAPRELDHADLRRILRSIFGTRRKSDALLNAIGPPRLAGAIDDLLHGTDALPERVLAFDGIVFADFPDAGFDLPGELLHFTWPDRYWLWSRWMWDPRTSTGALALVTSDDYDLDAADRGAGYLRVGEAVAFVTETGRQAGFTSLGDSTRKGGGQPSGGPATGAGAPGRTAMSRQAKSHEESLFGLDVFLACVYAVYMYTVLRLRMTQEFNKIVPELPDLVRRLLGVHRPPGDWGVPEKEA